MAYRGDSKRAQPTVAGRPGPYVIQITDSLVVAMGTGAFTLPTGPGTDFEVTIIRNDVTNATTINAGGADLISLAGSTASQRKLNSNGASLSLIYDAGIWWVYASQGTVA